MARTTFIQKFLVAVTLIVFSTIQATNAYECQEHYPFPSCPRPNTADGPDDTLCCQVDEVYQCCEDTLMSWAITLVGVPGLVILIVLLTCFCCCCGACTLCIQLLNFVIAVIKSFIPNLKKD